MTANSISQRNYLKNGGEKSIDLKGITIGHAFSVLGYLELIRTSKPGKYQKFDGDSKKKKNEIVRLLKLRNPNGRSNFEGRW